MMDQLPDKYYCKIGYHTTEHCFTLMMKQKAEGDMVTKGGNRLIGMSRKSNEEEVNLAVC
jgi:hypothetical protein